jgi:hypothetical protein
MKAPEGIDEMLGAGFIRKRVETVGRSDRTNSIALVRASPRRDFPVALPVLVPPPAEKILLRIFLLTENDSDG